MRNPNEVKFQTTTTSTEFICQYGYNKASMMMMGDFSKMVETYGADKVTIVKDGSTRWIVVRQPLFSNEVVRMVESTFHS